MTKPPATKVPPRVVAQVGSPVCQFVRVDNGTTWPWPIPSDPDNDSLSHRLRYTVGTQPLTRDEQLYLAEVYAAYRALITSPSIDSLKALRRHARETR